MEIEEHSATEDEDEEEEAKKTNADVEMQDVVDDDGDVKMGEDADAMEYDQVHIFKHL